MPVGDFKRDIMNWPSRGVLATHDYGCQPSDAEGLKRFREAQQRGQAALLDARRRKGLHLAGEPTTQGAAHEHILPAEQSKGHPGGPPAD